MVLLSFDIEEFDMPLEYGKTISFQDQIAISESGCEIILDLLKKHAIKATFFSTAVFAKQAPHIIDRIKKEGHELASHTYYHSTFEPAHLRDSKNALEACSEMKVSGLRMPRMMPVDDALVAAAGYHYNSSVNPTWLPGRYNHLKTPRTCFKKDNVWQIPASVSPKLRIPLFWLSFHNFPLRFYRYLCRRTFQKDGYLNLYFHPWEFIDLRNKERFGFPSYIRRNTGQTMIDRMENLLIWLNKNQWSCSTFSAFVNTLDR